MAMTGVLADGIVVGRIMKAAAVRVGQSLDVDACL